MLFLYQHSELVSNNVCYLANSYPSKKYYLKALTSHSLLSLGTHGISSFHQYKTEKSLPRCLEKQTLSGTRSISFNYAHLFSTIYNYFKYFLCTHLQSHQYHNFLLNMKQILENSREVKPNEFIPFCDHISSTFLMFQIDCFHYFLLFRRLL